MEPDLEGIRAAVIAFGSGARPDRSWAALAKATTPHIDPFQAAHRRALLVWLNAWGCRIRYPRQGETDLFDLGVARWWNRWHNAFVAADTSLADLTDEEIEYVGECYADLAATPVAAASTARSLGPTAASKLLHALRPGTLMPWDAAIAERLHGARDAAAYSGHQRLGRGWARRILAEAGTDEAALSSALGQPGRTLAKMLDDYCYVMITRGATSP